MDIKSISTDELLLEIENRRKEKYSGNLDNILCVGSIGIDLGESFVDMFIAVKTPNDLPDMAMLSLRHRFNGHRGYRLFTIKTTNFKALEERYLSDNEGFSDWVNKGISDKRIKEYRLV